MKLRLHIISIILLTSSIMMAMPPKHEMLDSLRRAGDTERLEEISHRMTMQREKAQQIRQRRIAAQANAAIPLNLAPRGLVIMVNYADKKFTTSAEEIEAMINSDNYSRSYKLGIKTIKASGSARQYFKDVSWGQYTPTFDVVGPVELQNNMSYYGKNDRNGDDAHAIDMIIEACQCVDNEVDFTQYDNNGDGEIDFVFVIYAGYGEADGGPEESVWPHSYWVKDGGGKTVRLDGKLLNTYACTNEIGYDSKQHNGIGTFVHEFSHVLGLPDLYPTNNKSHNTLGDWDVMDYGPYNNDGNTPPAYTAYERFFCGWLTPKVIPTTSQTYTIGDINTTRAALLICESGEHNLVGNDPSPTTFYMIENRQKSGWDKYLPGEGMLLTKIKYTYKKWTDNTVNNEASNMGVDIIEADGRSSSGGDSGDTFPDGATSYTGISGYELTNIQLNDGIISINVNGGGKVIDLDVENTTEIVRAKKIMRDGQIIIVIGEKEYNVLGIVNN